jgi:hypothetical protein
MKTLLVLLAAAVVITGLALAPRIAPGLSCYLVE